jgi:hypothetical protein
LLIQWFFLEKRVAQSFIMQRLHEDDLVGHVLQQGDWKILRFPAIAVEDETHVIKTPYGIRTVQRRVGEALHPERESVEVLGNIRSIQGEYNFAGQYQQEPAPLGGGMVKLAWFKTYKVGDEPAKFDMVFQSWDTAVKATQLCDYSVCTPWGKKDKNLYLLSVLRRRMEYPELKRAVRGASQPVQSNNHSDRRQKLRCPTDSGIALRGFAYRNSLRAEAGENHATALGHQHNRERLCVPSGQNRMAG